jgi:chromosome segregation ATPase
MIEPVEIMNRFTEYSPSKGEEPLPLPIPGHWFRKICALAERIARAENERDTLRARITELEADRDSESRWAKAYLARAERAETEVEQLHVRGAELENIAKVLVEASINFLHEISGDGRLPDDVVEKIAELEKQYEAAKAGEKCQP